MRHHYFVADVFTDKALEGNQVAVFTDGTDVDETRMQAVAREMKLAETVFLLTPQAGGDVRVRIFTPRAELPFAGHPVLGTSFVVGSLNDKLVTVNIETGMGIVPVALERDSTKVIFGRMDQPIPTVEPFDRIEPLLKALGLSDSRLPVEVYSNGPEHVYVELESKEAVKALRPDLGALSSLGPLGVNCFAGDGNS